jgi:4,5-DOPA dioxygenase extradiol
LRWGDSTAPYAWASDFDDCFQGQLRQRNLSALVQAPLQQPSGKLSIPTPDHYWPALYVLYQGLELASISMLSFAFGIPS